MSSAYKHVRRMSTQSAACSAMGLYAAYRPLIISMLGLQPASRLLRPFCHLNFVVGKMTAELGFAPLAFFLSAHYVTRNTTILRHSAASAPPSRGRRFCADFEAFILIKL